MKRIGLVVGTRPELIKLAPVYHALRACGFETSVILSGQHGPVLAPLLKFFRIESPIHLEVSVTGGLSAFGGALLSRLDEAFKSNSPDCIIVQGDTTTALIGAISAAYVRLPVAHVEAGLRTPAISEPFPEELNRRMISEVATWHFAPTPGAAENLDSEGHRDKVYVVGNTSVDAALWTIKQPVTRATVKQEFPSLRARRYVVVTAHRRESFGPRMQSIGRAVDRLAEANNDLNFIVALHTNPHAREPLEASIANRANVILTGPLPYEVMIGLIANAFAVLTDSGGLQEEAPSFGTPVLVLRDVTERPEGIQAGCSILVGTQEEVIIEHFNSLTLSASFAKTGELRKNPYGDGTSSSQIAAILRLC